MTGLVGVTVFDIGLLQYRNPDFLADRLVVSPRLMGVWIVENGFVLLFGEGLLIEQCISSLRL